MIIRSRRFFDKMKTYDFLIANLGIRLEVPWRFPDSPRFSPFQKDGIHPDLRVLLSVEDALPPIPEAGLIHGPVCYACSGDKRYCHHLENGVAFAVTEYEKGLVSLRIKRGYEHYFSTFSAVFNRIDFENILPFYNRFLLHASFCEKDGKGVLFAGPSGAGKSTQARLWEKFRSWRVVNGDRAVLEKTSEGFLAHGSPWAGSSEIYVNQTATVLLAALPVQAPSNEAKALDRGEAFHRIFPHIALCRWDGEAVAQAMALCDAFVESVPVFHLACRADEEAVSRLEEVLF